MQQSKKKHNPKQGSPGRASQLLALLPSRTQLTARDQNQGTSMLLFTDLLYYLILIRCLVSGRATPITSAGPLITPRCHKRVSTKNIKVEIKRKQ